jgi:hypothetical protein
MPTCDLCGDTGTVIDLTAEPPAEVACPACCPGESHNGLS